MHTLGNVCDEQKGFGPGFNLLRVTLAITIMAYHSFSNLSQSAVWYAQPFWIITNSLVPMFFALSGFLISASAMRLSLGQFLLNRGLRIVPALAIEIFLSAMVIGPLFTSLTLWQYFANDQFLRYFTNIIGLINYRLPGLFYYHSHYLWTVNAALWTIPYEITCYVMISIIILCRLFNWPFIIMAATAILSLLPDFLRPYFPTPWHAQVYGEGSLLFPSFLMGHLFYVLRYRIPFNAMLFTFCCLILAIFSMTLSITTMHIHYLVCLFAFCITYLTIYIGMSRLPQIAPAARGDYSYSIYLYHCPVINCIQCLTPWNKSAFMLFILSIFPVVTLAACSWHFIEKPILRMRKKFSFIGNRLECSHVL